MAQRESYDRYMYRKYKESVRRNPPTLEERVRQLEEKVKELETNVSSSRVPV